MLANGVWRIELPGAARLLRYQREDGEGDAFHGMSWSLPVIPARRFLEDLSDSWQ